jgi:hypothetical protein
MPERVQRVVVNTTPIIALSLIGRLNPLQQPHFLSPTRLP